MPKLVFGQAEQLSQKLRKAGFKVSLVYREFQGSQGYKAKTKQTKKDNLLLGS